MHAGRTEALSKVLNAPFTWTSPDVHVVPAPAELEVLGLVPSDEKSASGDCTGSARSGPPAVPAGCHCLAHCNGCVWLTAHLCLPIGRHCQTSLSCKAYQISSCALITQHKVPIACEAAPSIAVGGHKLLPCLVVEDNVHCLWPRVPEHYTACSTDNPAHCLGQVPNEAPVQPKLCFIQCLNGVCFLFLSLAE